MTCNDCIPLALDPLHDLHARDVRRRIYGGICRRPCAPLLDIYTAPVVLFTLVRGCAVVLGIPLRSSSNFRLIRLLDQGLLWVTGFTLSCAYFMRVWYL